MTPGDAPDAGATAADALFWKKQADAAHADASSARRELSDLREAQLAAEAQVAFLRRQLTEASEENRALRELLAGPTGPPSHPAADAGHGPDREESADEAGGPALGLPAHPGYGEHEDDVLPAPDRKGRRRS